MSDVKQITVDAVNNKPFNPQYNSGSVLCGEVWYSVARSIDIAQFQRGATYEVTITSKESKGKTYYNITKLHSGDTPVAPEAKPKGPIMQEYNTASAPAAKPRDYTKEAKGKCYALFLAHMGNSGLTPLEKLDVADVLVKGMEDRGHF